MLRCRGLGPGRTRRVLPGRGRRSDPRSARMPPGDPLRVRRACGHQRRCRVPDGSSPRTVAPGLATRRAPRRGTTSIEPRELHEPRMDAPRPTGCVRKPRSLPEAAVPLRWARPRLRHMAGVVQARRGAEPAAHVPLRCDRDRRPRQEPPATGPCATEWPLRRRLRDEGVTGRRIGKSGSSFGIVPLSLSTTVVVRTSKDREQSASRLNSSLRTRRHLEHVGCRPVGSPAVRTQARRPGLTGCPPTLDCVSEHLRAPHEQD